MTATGFIYGYAAEYDPLEQVWRWTDTGEPAGPPWGGQTRACPVCDRHPTAEGHDACLGTLDNVVSACCGHGVEPPYFMSSEYCTARYARDRCLVVGDTHISIDAMHPGDVETAIMYARMRQAVRL